MAWGSKYPSKSIFPKVNQSSAKKSWCGTTIALVCIFSAIIYRGFYAKHSFIDRS
jgi:hypothetical protein